MKSSLVLILLAAGLSGCDDSKPQATPAPVGTTSTPGTVTTPRTVTPSGGTLSSSSSSTTQPTNTGINDRDRNPGAPTAGMASQAKSDIDIAAAIRRQVTDTKMSINAQNVKIVTDGGKVVLRGPVANQVEKDMIATIANQVAGAANVDNQIEVAP